MQGIGPALSSGHHRSVSIEYAGIIPENFLVNEVRHPYINESYVVWVEPQGEGGYPRTRRCCQRKAISQALTAV